MGVKNLGKSGYMIYGRPLGCAQCLFLVSSPPHAMAMISYLVWFLAKKTSLAKPSLCIWYFRSGPGPVEWLATFVTDINLSGHLLNIIA